MLGMENVRLAFTGLSASKVRSALTMLGITIGVASVIILVSVGQAFEAYIYRQFSSMGTNQVYVFGKLSEDYTSYELLTQADADALADVYRVPDAALAAPIVEVGGDFGTSIVFDGREATARVHGATTDYLSVYNREVAEGRFYTDEEVSGGARVAVIGTTLVEKLFPDTHPIGQDVRVTGIDMEAFSEGAGSQFGREIHVGGTTLQIIGILEDAGTSGFGELGDLDNLLVVPLTTAQERLSGERTVGGERPVSAIVLQARDKNAIPAVIEQIRQTLREEHEIGFRDEDDFEIMTMDDLLASLGAVTGILTLFLGVIAGVSLLVGGIGIMNIMLVTVTERTHEIGLRKAVGALKRDILLQFLTEATVLALLGGVAGLATAWALAQLVTVAVPDLAVTIQVSSVVLATVICVLIGIFFGIYPANRAADLNPIDALRYE